MKKFGEVTYLYSPDGVPSAGTASGDGVPAGTPVTEPGDANGAGDIQKQLEKLEQDRRAQQAVYDRKLAEAEKRNQELADRLKTLQTTGMDEAQKAAFERDQALQRLAEIETRQRMNDYANAFAEQYGIDKTKLDMSSEEALAQSGWQAVAELVSTLKQQVQGTPPPAAATQKAPPQNTTKVITGSGGVPRTAPSQMEFMTQVAQGMGKQSITMEEFYRWAEGPGNTRYNQWLRDISSE